MSRGDLDYFVGLIRNSQLPQGWFPEDAPVLDALVTAMATGSAFNFTQIEYINLQTRLQTATDRNLDIFALEYFGANRVYRHPDEDDDHYRGRILRALNLEKGTRQGLIDALTAIGGVPPKVLEPANPQDCGGYGVGGVGYGVAGAYGNLSQTYQVFVTAYQAPTARVPGLAGYGSLDAPNMPGGYGVGSIEYVEAATVDLQTLNSEILDTINDVIPAGVVCWVNIQPSPTS